MSKTHGMSDTPTHKIWRGIKQRCTNPNNPAYKNYGGRGIEVCDRWLNSFESFYEDMGERPEGMSIDRIDNDGNYEPGNCRWATNKEQALNMSTTRMVTFRGETKKLHEWADILGIYVETLRGRLCYGWNVEKAFTTPVLRKDNQKSTFVQNIYVDRHCGFCGEDFVTTRTEVKRGRGICCSRSCSSELRKAKWHRDYSMIKNKDKVIELLQSDLSKSKALIEKAEGALELLYGHCKLYHKEVEGNNVGEQVERVLAEIREGK